jgi:hypothetical protein
MKMGGTRRRTAALVVVMAVALVAVPTVPAAADHTAPPAGPVAGSGTLEGTERVLEENYIPPACFQTTKIIMDVRGEGTYHGRRPDGTEVVYKAELTEGQTLLDGALQVEVENTLPYYHGPYGTHGGDSSCSGATAGTPIEASFRIFAADHVYRLDDSGAQVPCAGQGSFVRKGTSGDFHAQWSLAAACTVVGNAAGVPGEGIAPPGTAHTHRGVHAPCFNVCTTNIRFDYAQHLPIDGVAVTLGGPNAALVADVVTVTAGVTDDGLPVPGAAVAFTVSGPAPAEPPGATSPTDTAGRATFSFTAAVEGDYTVTATATTAGDPGQTATATHTVTFGARRPNMTLSGPPISQTEEEVVVMAASWEDSPSVEGLYVTNYGRSVDFTVSGPGRTTPSQATVIANYGGQAYFAFVGERAGDYTVTATTTLQSGTVTRTHIVRLAVNTFKQAGALAFPDQSRLPSAVGDPAGRYAYFATGASVLKVDLATFQQVGAVALTGTNGEVASGVIDPGGRYAYFGTRFGSPGQVVRIDLATFQQAGVITLAAGESNLQSAVIDPRGDFAYFGVFQTGTAPGRVVKVDLKTFQRVGAVTFDTGETIISAVIDPAGRSAYFATAGAGSRLVKVDLATFQRAATIALPYDDGALQSGVVDPAGKFAYFATTSQLVVKIDLVAFQRVGTIALPEAHSTDNVLSAVVDPAGRFAYFGKDSQNYERGELTIPGRPRLYKVDLATFQVAHTLTPDAASQNLTSAVMAPDGSHAYFGGTPSGPKPWEERQPPKIIKLALTRPAKAALAAAADSYPTPYLTPLSVAAPGVLGNDADTEDGDALTAHDASDPAHGSVALNPDGSFTYTPDRGFSGTDTFTYVASDGMDYSAPATVTVTVAPRPEWNVASVTGSAYGYHSNVSLFGGPYAQRGPAPTVAVSPDAANSPQDAHVDTAEAVYGPAVIFRSGPIDVHAEGALGPAGYASASSTVHGHPDPTQRPGPFLYDQVRSTCTADEAETPPAVSVTNGVVETSYHVGDDPNTPEVEQGGDVKTTQAVPTNPPPGYTIEGTIDHVGDRFRIVFNEQTTNADGSLTVNAAHMELLGPTAVGDVFIARSTCGAALGATARLAPVADFDGDADTDISVFRAGSGAWYVKDRPTVYHGLAGDAAVPANYDADPETDIAVFRPSNGAWYLQGQPTAYHGRNGDIPVPANYDADPEADLAVFRPANGGWYVQGQAPVFFGRDGDIPVPGSYDTDADVDLAVFRPSTGAWYVQGSPTVYFGRSGDIPVPADYDGDGDTDIAVFRPSSGAWLVQGQATVYLGAKSDVPVPGYYDAGPTADMAVFRPSNGGWYRPGQATVYFGRSGDAPLPLPHAIRQAFFGPSP